MFDIHTMHYKQLGFENKLSIEIETMIKNIDSYFLLSVENYKVYDDEYIIAGFIIDSFNKYKKTTCGFEDYQEYRDIFFSSLFRNIKTSMLIEKGNFFGNPSYKKYSFDYM